MYTQPDPNPKPPRPELQKYQAGVFLIILSLAVGSLGLFFGLSSFLIVAGFLLITGIVFQFDKNRPKGRLW